MPDPTDNHASAFGAIADTTRDIGRKCEEDVTDTIARGMRLAELDIEGRDGGVAMAQVAMYGAAGAVGAAAGAFTAVIHHAFGQKPAPDDMADELLALLRPMVLRGMTRLDAGQSK